MAGHQWSKPRCKGLTAKGNSCAAKALPEGYCLLHLPPLADGSVDPRRAKAVAAYTRRIRPPKDRYHKRKLRPCHTPFAAIDLSDVPPHIAAFWQEGLPPDMVEFLSEGLGPDGLPDIRHRKT